MKQTRFLMIGGFLGAGKTTAIARLARHYIAQGLRVGLVTNDQAYGLVDTMSLKAQGFDVGEVPGACFCCKFNELVDTAARLGEQNQPDIIITEPVGSCTDLMATVVHPLRHLYGDRYDIGPLTVLCKPEHGRKILGGSTGGFTPQAAYIFLKQLEEAQVIVLNKADRLAADEQHELYSLLRRRFQNKQIQVASALTGDGFDDILEILSEDAPLQDAPLEIDYDTYAEGEAALGWFNASVQFASPSEPPERWPLDCVVLALVEELSDLLDEAGIEPGHVKVLASADSHISIANWVASDSPTDLSVSSDAEVLAADFLINVRVLGDPEQVSELVKQVISKVAEGRSLFAKMAAIQYFRPNKPTPVHRYDGSMEYIRQASEKVASNLTANGLFLYSPHPTAPAERVLSLKNSQSNSSPGRYGRVLPSPKKTAGSYRASAGLRSGWVRQYLEQMGCSTFDSAQPAYRYIGTRHTQRSQTDGANYSVAPSIRPGRRIEGQSE